MKIQHTRPQVVTGNHSTSALNNQPEHIIGRASSVPNCNDDDIFTTDNSRQSHRLNAPVIYAERTLSNVDVFPFTPLDSDSTLFRESWKNDIHESLGHVADAVVKVSSGFGDAFVDGLDISGQFFKRTFDRTVDALNGLSDHASDKLLQDQRLDNILTTLQIGETWQRGQTVEFGGHIMLGGTLTHNNDVAIIREENSVVVRINRNKGLQAGIGLTAGQAQRFYAQPVGLERQAKVEYRFDMPTDQAVLENFIRQYNQGDDGETLERIFQDNLLTSLNGYGYLVDAVVDNSLFNMEYQATRSALEGRMRLDGQLFDARETTHHQGASGAIKVPIVFDAATNIVQGERALQQIRFNPSSAGKAGILFNQKSAYEQASVRIIQLTSPSSINGEPDRVIVERHVNMEFLDKKMQIIHRVQYKNLSTLTKYISNAHNLASPQDFIDQFVGHRTRMDETDVLKTFLRHAPLEENVHDYIHSTTEIRDISYAEKTQVGLDTRVSKLPLYAVVLSQSSHEKAPAIVYRRDSLENEAFQSDDELANAFHQISISHDNSREKRKQIMDVARQTVIKP